ncbi:MAG: polysaccharide biosynthesis tyrosine autokinase [Bacteroidales bacterium]|nr:polysaccharide biosynthesis tyrosine autokinase [Bacteroidales bacterium]
MSNQKESKSEAYIFKEFLLTALSYKYFYLICFIVFMAFAFTINKLSRPVYGLNSIIGPIDDQRNSLLGSNNLFSGMDAFSEVRNLENDMTSLNSFNLISTTIKELNLEVGYFTENKSILTHSRQIYKQSPFSVNIDKSHIQPINSKFYIKLLDDKSFRLTSSEEEVTLYNYVDNLIVSKYNSVKIDTICKFNETITNKNFKFSVSFNKDLYVPDPKDKSELYFVLYHLDLLSKEYLKRLKIEPVSIKSSLINASFQGSNLELTIDFLNNYLQAYLDDNLSKKNKIALSTINFIDSQISNISDSLLKSESRLKDYRSANQVTDLSYQGQQALEQMTKVDAERSSYQIQERYYNYILDYLNKNQDVGGLALPSSSNVVDPIMNQLVLDLLDLNSQKSNILSNNTEKNLFLGQIENKIKLQKQAIIENVTNSLNTMNLAQNELNYRADKLSRDISKLPRTELNMVSMQRKFNLTDAMYTFLLQKRSEAAITMASNIPDYEILEPARETSSKILAPKKVVNWGIALFLTIFIPTLFIILKNFFNEKITGVHDLENLLGRPILSLIFSNPFPTEAVVYESPGSSISESFRNLRSSLFLRLKSEQVKVILITSSQPQDGKSFVSFNLASSIASVGYKTIILDCDLRRPTLHHKFKESNTDGLSNYMTDNAPKEQIIHDTFIKNLAFIPAGPVLPNSSELIESGALDGLINDLKKSYEYIIIDTTPSGIVADAALMIKYSNINLLVCRNNFTRRDFFNDVLTLLKSNKVENFDVVFNDVNIEESRYGRYRSYYTKG